KRSAHTIGNLLAKSGGGLIRALAHPVAGPPSAIADLFVAALRFGQALYPSLVKALLLVHSRWINSLVSFKDVDNVLRRSWRADLRSVRQNRRPHGSLHARGINIPAGTKAIELCA